LFWEQSANLIGPPLKKKETMETHQYKRFYCEVLRGTLLTHQIIGERRITTSGKAYGIKVRCYGEHVGEHIGNLGTYSKSDGNPLGT